MKKGIAVPLRSLHSNQSGGIGEFLDLKILVDWCSEVGFNVIQLLPLNDTGTDPSPYSALSAYALNPTYIHLEGIDKTPAPYHVVARRKKDILLDYVSKEPIDNDPAFATYVADNPWLPPYAEFRALRDQNEAKHWISWCDTTVVDTALVDSYIKMQFLAHSQLTSVKEYANKKGVELMGDIPILINTNSADVYTHRHLFNLELTVGAPPDQFSELGQNWGVPMYRWDAHEEEGYKWWIERVKLAENYYHLYRLDHVIGFFRFWAIPPAGTGRDGFFIPDNLDEALHLGKKHLELMQSASTMLPIGEDLGVIPHEVRAQMRALGIPGTKVMRWERRWDGDGSYILPSEFDRISMTCTSTHDCETLRHWWHAYPADSQLLSRQMGWSWEPQLSAQRQHDLLLLAHTTNSDYLINPLQDYLGLHRELTHKKPKDERINIPGTQGSDNWSFRFIPSLETLTSHAPLADSIKKLCSHS